jgi:hypothetical protein
MKKELTEAAAELADLRARISKLEMMSEQRVCGLLEVNRLTLIKLPIPRITLRPGVVRYRLKDVEQFVADCVP